MNEGAKHCHFRRPTDHQNSKPTKTNIIIIVIIVIIIIVLMLILLFLLLLLNKVSLLSKWC